MIVSGHADGNVLSDLHSVPDGAPEGYAESFVAQEGTPGGGTYVAPFSGIHGWYWENVDTKDVRIRLATAGFYSGALEFFDGGRANHEVRDLRGKLLERPQR